MSGLYTKSNGSFKISQANLKNLSSWKDAFQIYLKMSNTWRKTYNYYYTYTNWSSCSKSCGGGTQTRSAICNRSDGIVKDLSYCKKYGITTDSLAQSCNTQSCSVPVYIYTSYDDQHCLSYYSRISNQLINLGWWYSGYKHNDRYHIDGTYNFNYAEFPIRFVFQGSNYSNKGGPRTTYFRVNGGTLNNLLPHYVNWGTADMTLYFELDINSNLNRISGWSWDWQVDLVNAEGFPYNDGYCPWTSEKFFGCRGAKPNR